jgi:hypothetical protein
MAAIPPDLRSRLEQARLDSLALFRVLDRLDLSPPEIPQRLLRQLFELDADCAEALWALDQPRRSFNLGAMLRDTRAALNKLPAARKTLREKLPTSAQTRRAGLEAAMRAALDPREAYNGIPGRDPQVR